MKEILIRILEFFGLAWWVEVATETPECTYYFGPFLTAKEAQANQSGYIKDLELEGAKGIRVEVKRCKPRALTIDAAADDVKAARGVSPILSSQL